MVLCLHACFCPARAEEPINTIPPSDQWDSLSVRRLSVRASDSSKWFGLLGRAPKGEWISQAFRLRNRSQEAQKVYLQLPYAEFHLLMPRGQDTAYLTGSRIDLDKRQLRYQDYVLRCSLKAGESQSYVLVSGSLTGKPLATGPPIVMGSANYRRQ